MIPPTIWNDRPVKGVFYMVLQNGDIQGARATIRSIEDRFNHVYQYPWVFLSDQPYTYELVNNLRTLSTAPMFFGRIDPEVWHYPSWISGVRLENTMQSMANRGVNKATSLLYRQRARYHSGFYFRHPLLQDVEYAWHAEPGSYYSCDMEEKDLFLEMKERNKTLGFAMSSREDPIQATIMPWLINERGKQSWPADFNYCQIWSHFGIVKLAYLRSEEYMALFEFLDSTGGFFYERWSDSMVQTLGAAMFLTHDQLHFFHHIGYSYESETHCPLSTTYSQRCGCDLTASTYFQPDRCAVQLLRLMDPAMYAQHSSVLNGTR
ncbi:nucleotide-diphospho-sugar transferase [Dichotomocladium elegans]|nr:nucleotide-diphospho-sugar transferase [Dichotomocladium elegans]